MENKKLKTNILLLGKTSIKNSKKSDIVTIRSGTYLPYQNNDYFFPQKKFGFWSHFILKSKRHQGILGILQLWVESQVTKPW